MYAASPVFIYFGFVVHRNSGHVLFFRGICFVEKLLSLHAAFIFKLKLKLSTQKLHI